MTRDEQQLALIEALVPEGIRAIQPYKVADATGMVKLDAMENPWHWPDAMVEEWMAQLRSVDINRYPSASAPNLKAAIRKQMGVSDTDDILLGNGSDELIQIISMMVSQAGRPIMALEPSFVMYKMVAMWMGVPFVPVTLDQNFQINLVDTLAAIASERPSVIFIAQPNNPTGNLFDLASIKSIAAASEGLVILDEAYTAFSDSDLLPMLAEFPNVLVMRTLSKVGLAGLRLGMLIGSKAWIAELDKLRLPYNINVLTQLSTEFAIKHFHVFEAQTQTIRENRTRLFDALSAMQGLRVWPSAANFLLVKTERVPAKTVFERLRSHGILVKILDGAHPLLKDCLRINVSSIEENDMLLKAMAHSLIE